MELKKNLYKLYRSKCLFEKDYNLRMKFIMLLIAFFCLLGFTQGLTAKEAHDKTLDCAKKCSRHPSVLRCEMHCKQEKEVIPKQANHKARSNKNHKVVETKKVHPPLVKQGRTNPRIMTIKGRRVVLVRKN